MVIDINMTNFGYDSESNEMSNNDNIMDSVSQTELFQKYCSLLKKQDFDNADILFNDINWYLLVKSDCPYILKTVPIITEDFLLNIFCSIGSRRLWDFYIDFFILKSRIRRKMSPKVEAYGWKYVYQIDYVHLDDKFILIDVLNRITLNNRMTDKELEYYNRLPDKFMVYRGTNENEYESGKIGVSWTPEQKVAEYFAYRREEQDSLVSKRIVLATTICKEDITACLLDRNESELIIDSKKLSDIHVLLTQRTDLYDVYAKEVKSGYKQK